MFIIWGSFDVLKVFPIQFSRDSHQVPNVFPKVFPNSITVLPHLICPKLSFHAYKLQRRGWGRRTGGRGGKHLCAFILGSAQCFQKKKEDRPMRVAPLEEKKEKKTTKK
jgi:hypothetical protein